MSKKAASRLGKKRTAARLRAIRRRAAAWQRKARKAITLALIAGCLAEMHTPLAYAQMGGMGQAAMAPSGGLVNRAMSRLGELEANGPGWMYYGINAADRGLGYNGSYMTVGGFIPYAEDDLGGFWAADLRGHLSEYGGFFSNVGFVRKQFLGGSLLGIGVYWDYDGDQNQYPTGGSCGTGQFGQFGHTYNQVGISGEWLTDFGNLRSNGYIPVGTTAYTAGAPNSPFFQNYVMCQYGLDAALTGADLEVGAYVPGLADWAGMISVGGYALGNARYDWSNGPLTGKDVVPYFGGVYTRLDMTFIKNWDFSLQANNDSFFDWTGFARLTYRMGGSRRRNVPDQMEQPMMRNEHIVRAHQTPVLAANPNNAGTPWRVIHVNNAAAAGGNGTAEAPFQTVAQANAAATNPWDIVLVNRGLSSYNTTTGVVTSGYAGNFVPLAANQYFIGDGSSFFIPTVCCGPLNIAVNTNGTPVLSNPTGPSITLSDGLVANNFNVINSAIGIAGPGPSGDLSSAERGSLASNINIYRGPDYTGPTQGIVITDATGKADFQNVNIGKIVTSGTTTQDWTMSNGSVLVDGGDPQITFSGTGSIINNAGHILQVNDTTGGFVTLTAQAGVPFIENGKGIIVENAAGDVTVQSTVPGATAAIIKSQQDGINVNGSSGVQTFNDVQILAAGTNGLPGYAGVNLQNNAGSSQFNNLTISLTDPSNTATGFLATNDNVVDVTGNSSVNVTGAPAVSMTEVADANVNFKTITSTGSPSNGVIIDGVAGTFAVATSLTVKDAQQDAFVVRNSPNLTVSVPVTNISTATGAAADGIVLQNNKTDATTVNLGKVTVAVADGAGLVANNAGVTTSGGTITATGGASIAANKADVNITLASATSTTSAGAGLDLTETDGAVTIATTTVTSPTGVGINAVNNTPGFTADFGKTKVTGINNGSVGVNITNATDPDPDTLYSFDSLDITTVNGTGLRTKNGGTVNFTSPANITANGGAAIDLENTTGTTGGVAGSGFTFLDLSSVNSNANGIRLNNLNSALSVTGVTSISGASGPSILITDTAPAPATDSLAFNEVNITNRKNIGLRVDGIYGQAQFQNLNIDNANNVAGNAAYITNTTNPADPTGTGSGRVYIDGGTISNANGNAIEVQNALARITGTTLTGFIGQGILATAGAGQQTTVEVGNSTITSASGIDGLRLQASGGGIINGTIFSSVIDVPSNSLNAIVLDASSTISLNASNNIGPSGGPPTAGAFLLNNSGGGTLSIDQASTADLSTANNGVAVTPTGTITTGGNTPPVPPPSP
jgi:hypothetical protein